MKFISPIHEICFFGGYDIERDVKFDNTDPISLELFEKWSNSSDFEVLSVLYTYLDTKSFYKRISPALTLNQYLHFTKNFYSRCLLENIDMSNADWAVGRYQACWDMVGWFTTLWNDEKVPRKEIDDIKKWFEKLYKEGDEDIKDALLNGTFEHLFENKKIAKYFNDWLKDKDLTQVYKDAIFWVDKGGESPLGVKSKP